MRIMIHFNIATAIVTLLCASLCHAGYYDKSETCTQNSNEGGASSWLTGSYYSDGSAQCSYAFATAQAQSVLPGWA